MSEAQRIQDPNTVFANLMLLTRKTIGKSEAEALIREIRENRVIPEGNDSLIDHEFAISEGKTGRRKDDRRKEASIVLLFAGLIYGRASNDVETMEKLDRILMSWSAFFRETDNSSENYAREWFKFSVRHGLDDVNDAWTANHFDKYPGEKRQYSIVDFAAIEEHGARFFTPERLLNWIKSGWNPNYEETELISFGIAQGKIDATITGIIKNADMLESVEPANNEIIDISQTEDEHDKNLKANLGVWSEIGTFLTIATEGVLHVADGKSVIRIKSVSIDGHEAIIEDSNDLFIKGISKNKQLFEIEKKWAERILSNWDENFVRVTKASFAPKSSLAELLTRLSGGEGYTLNTSREKTDIVAIGETTTGGEKIFRISAKSLSYGDPTLFNAAAKSAIEYVVENADIDEAKCRTWLEEYKNESSSESTKISPINNIFESGGILRFERFVGTEYKNALARIDAELPEFVPLVIAAFNKFHGNESPHLADIIHHFGTHPEFLPDFLRQHENPKEHMEELVKKWLTAAATNMTSKGISASTNPNSITFSFSDETGKLHVELYPFDIFDIGDVLLKGAKIDSPSRSGHIAKTETPHPEYPDSFPYIHEDERMLRLNHQIRLRKSIYLPEAKQTARNKPK